MSTLEEYYGSTENCYKDIALARKVWGNKNATVEEWDGIIRGLAFMLIHCPECLYDLVSNTLDEAAVRHSYWELKNWKEDFVC
jgi:hypothetical protein